MQDTINWLGQNQTEEEGEFESKFQMLDHIFTTSMATAAMAYFQAREEALGGRGGSGAGGGGGRGPDEEGRGGGGGGEGREEEEKEEEEEEEEGDAKEE